MVQMEAKGGLFLKTPHPTAVDVAALYGHRTYLSE